MISLCLKVNLYRLICRHQKDEMDLAQIMQPMNSAAKTMRSIVMLLLCLAAFLAGPGQAAHESGPVGPYVVSFDMNTTMDYRVVVDEKPSSGVTTSGVKFSRYNLTVESAEYFARLMLTRYEMPMVANTSANAYIVYNALLGAGADEPQMFSSEDYPNISIDGRPAVLGNFRFDRQYLGQGQYQEGDLVVAAAYSPDAEPYMNETYLGQTDCRVISTYPWEVISYLLYTLHVEVPEEEAAEDGPEIESPANAPQNLTNATNETSAVNLAGATNMAAGGQ